MASAVMQPITNSDRMARRDPQGRSNAKEAKEFIKPNSRLTSFERLEIYNRQYWFRILDSFGEDFPGLRAVVGRKRFDQIARGYLTEHPSTSFTLAQPRIAAATVVERSSGARWRSLCARDRHAQAGVGAH